MALLSDLYQKYGAPVAAAAGNALQQRVVQPVEAEARALPGQVGGAISRNVVQPAEQAAGNAVGFLNQRVGSGHFLPDAVLQPSQQFQQQHPALGFLGGLASGIVNAPAQIVNQGIVNPVADVSHELSAARDGTALPYGQLLSAPGRLGAQIGRAQGAPQTAASYIGNATGSALPPLNAALLGAGGQALSALAGPAEEEGASALSRLGSAALHAGKIGAVQGAVQGVADAGQNGGSLGDEAVAGGKGLLQGGVTGAALGAAGAGLGITSEAVRRAAQNKADFGNLAAATHTYQADVPGSSTAQIKGVNVNGLPPDISKVSVPESQAESILRSHDAVPPQVVDPSATGPKVDISIDNATRKVVSWNPERPQFAQDIFGAARQGSLLQPQVGAVRIGPGEFPQNAAGKVNADMLSGSPEANAMAANNPDAPLQKVLPPNTGTGSDQVENKFVTRAKASPDVSEAARDQLEGTHAVRSNKELIASADARIAANPEAAHQFALTGNSDDAFATAIRLAAKYRDEGNFDAEAQLINQTARNGVEAGRRVQAMSLLSSMSPEGIAKTAAGSIERYNETAARKIPGLTGEQLKGITEQAKAIEAMPEGRDKGLATQKLWEGISRLTPSSWMDKFLALRRAGLLTAPSTLTKVVGSHVGMTGLEQASNTVGGKIVDPIVSLFSGQRGLVGTPKGLVEGNVAGARMGLDNLVHGYNPHEDPESILSRRVNFPTDYQGPVGAVRNAVNRGLQTYVDTTGRVHASLPMAGAEGARLQSLNDQALAAARNQGISGDAVRPFVRDFVSSPSDAAAKVAQRAADYASFQNKTALGEAATAMTQKLGAPGKFLVPFTQVPSAVATAITDYSPVGLAKAIYGAVRSPDGFTPEVQAQFSKEIGRSIVGSAAIAFGAALAARGLITTKPTDQKQADLWAAQGIPYNSVRLNGTWYPLGSYGPAGTALAVGAYAQAGTKDTKKTPGSLANAALAGGVGIGTVQLDQPYLQGASTIIDALKSPQTKLQTAVHSAAGSLVPSFLASAAAVQDPLKREQNGANSLQDIENGIKYRIPGLRQTLPAQVSVLGQPEPNAGSVAQKVFAPADSVQATTPVSAELSRLHDRLLDATPAAVGSTVTSFGISQQLTPAQQSQYQKQVGGDINSGLSQLIASPEYQGLDDSAKQAAIQKLDALVRQRDGINFTATNPLSQTNLSPQDPSRRQNAEQLKLQAAQAYQNGDGASYYRLLKQIPAQQQVTVANEIQQAFGDATAGKPLGAADQVIDSLRPASPTVLGSQQGALAHLNDFSSFVNKRNFELNSPDPQPIYRLPDAQAAQALAVKAQLPGVSSPYIDAIKAQPWYKQYSAAQSAWYDRNPTSPDYVSPAGPAPSMTAQESALASQIASVKAAGGSTAAYYDTPAGKDLTGFYSQAYQYDNKKLSLVNLPPAYVPSTQYPGELAAVGSAGAGGAGTASSSAYASLKARDAAKSARRTINYDQKKIKAVQARSTMGGSVKAPTHRLSFVRAHIRKTKISKPKQA